MNIDWEKQVKEFIADNFIYFRASDRYMTTHDEDWTKEIKSLLKGSYPMKSQSNLQSYGIQDPVVKKCSLKKD